jgi:hypothetical protein
LLIGALLLNNKSVRQNIIEFHTIIKAHTFVLVICKRRGENEGCSPAPTNATSDVQKSISTIPIPPSAIKIITV